MRRTDPPRRNAQRRITGTGHIATEICRYHRDAYTAFNEIINGHRPITTDTALKSEAATGITANLWIGLQSDYNMQTARRDTGLSAVLDQIRKAVAVL